jgi:hypothetical protein
MARVVTAPVALVTVFLACGCACPTVRTVIPLSESTPRELSWMGSERELPIEECRKLCGAGGRLTGCRVHPMRAGSDEGGHAMPTGRAVVCDQVPSCPGGRAPTEVDLSAPVRAASHDGAFWAAVARMEAVSIASFLRLAGELRAHGAPRGLIARAALAARQEQVHATRIAGVAVRLGAELPEVPVLSLDVRALEAVALENEVEGCVHERWSAAVVAHQAAALPELSARLQPIAVDEAQHAQLALDVGRWLRDRHGPRLAGRLDAAREEARASLLGSLDDTPRSPSLGLPFGERAHALAAATLS